MCDYPLNLSILIRGGKETNKDSPSSCERNGKSSARRGDTLPGVRPVPCTGGFVICRNRSLVQVQLECGFYSQRG